MGYNKLNSLQANIQAIKTAFKIRQEQRKATVEERAILQQYTGFGGIGSIPGALIGGILLGIIEILGKAYISSQMADAIVFGVLIVVLLVKPSGLLGKRIQEKV